LVISFKLQTIDFLAIKEILPFNRFGGVPVFLLQSAGIRLLFQQNSSPFYFKATFLNKYSFPGALFQKTCRTSTISIAISFFEKNQTSKNQTSDIH